MEPFLSGLEREFAALSLSGVTETGKELGRGSYGEVREADWLGTPCATKRVHSLLVSQAGTEEISKASLDFVRECRTWKDLRHPHIVQLLGVVFEQASPLPVLVMERLSTSLRCFLEDHPKAQFPLNRKAAILHQVSLGLAYLHSLKYIHRDLSTNNILLDADTWRAKITDFGVTRVLDTTRSRMTGTFVPGTQAFMPPEVLEIPAQFSDKVDVFSFGCVVISTLTHQWPDPGPAKRREGGKLLALTESQRREHYFGMFTLQEKELFQRLTEGCLQEEPSSRPSSSAVVEELATIREEASKRSSGEISAVPGQVTGGPTAATRGNQPPTQGSSSDQKEVARHRVEEEARKDSKGETSAVPDQVTGGPTAATRGSQSPTQVVAVSPVILAAKRGQLSTVRKLLDGGAATVEDQDEEGKTALLWASYEGHLSVVRELVNIYKVNLFQKDEESKNAMHMAAEGGHIEVIKFLLPLFGERVHEKANASYTMLHWAAHMGHCQVARYLIEEVQMDPQDRDKWEYTALLRAAFGGSVPVVRMLLEDYGSSVDELTELGWNALHLAAFRGHLELVKFLIPILGEKKFAVTHGGNTCLTLAIEGQKEDVVVYLIQEGGFGR